MVAVVMVMSVALGEPRMSPAIQASTVPQWQTAAGGKMEFEVASVRKSAPEAPSKGTEFLVPFDMPSAFPKGLFSANAPLFSYIAFAYKISDFSQYRALESRGEPRAPGLCAGSGQDGYSGTTA
jgi:hypothetical protein